MEFNQLLNTYTEKFGVTFSVFAAYKSQEVIDKATNLMQEALDGKRAQVTNADLEIFYPDGVNQ